MERRLWPDIIVTDLDGEVPPEATANEAQCLSYWPTGTMCGRSQVVPRLNGWITPTTQVKPHGRLLNFGGFTDSDGRCELSRHLGARRINLLGFDFENPTPRGGSRAGDETEETRLGEGYYLRSEPALCRSLRAMT